MPEQIISTITSKGQVTIPVQIRRQLGLGKSDKIVFIINPNQNSVQLKVPQFATVSSLKGAAGSLKKPLPWKKVKQIAQEDRLKAKYAD